MPRTCTVCGHPKRPAIDRALVAGESSNRRIAAQYGTTERAIRDHKANHLKVRMLKAVDRREEADIRTAIDVVGQLRTINGAALSILKEARKSRDGELALKAIDRIQRQIELQAKLIGELQQEGTTNIIVAPEWVSIRTVMLTALAEHPNARMSVASALQSLEQGNVHATD